MENSPRNNQRAFVVGETDLNLDRSDENQVSHGFRSQKDRFSRSVSEGPQVPIPKAIQVPVQEEPGNNDTLVHGSNYVVRSVSEGPQVPILRIFQVPIDARAPDAPVPRIAEIVDLLDNDMVPGEDDENTPYRFKRRSNSRSRINQLYDNTHKVKNSMPNERKLRSRNPIDYTEGQLPPGLSSEDLYERYSTPPPKRGRIENTEPNTIIIISSSDNEQQINNDDFQDEHPHESDNMTRIGGASSDTVLEPNSGTQNTQRNGSEADINTNPSTTSCQAPAPATQMVPESNEGPNISATVAPRSNPGGELNMVSQPHVFSSDTVYFTASENFGMSDFLVTRQGEDVVNTETANGEISKSVENRARDSGEIKGSQFPSVKLPPPINIPQPFNIPQPTSTSLSEIKEAFKRSVLAIKEQALVSKQQALARKDHIIATKDQIIAREDQTIAMNDSVLRQAEEELKKLG